MTFHSLDLVIDAFEFSDGDAVVVPDKYAITVSSRVHVYGLVRTTNMRPQWNEALQRQMLPHEVSDSTYVGEVVVV